MGQPNKGSNTTNTKGEKPKFYWEWAHPLNFGSLAKKGAA
jgi:hypothetical protein